MSQTNFEHGLRSKVRIIPLDVEGIVIGFYFGDNGPQYQVAYFLNGNRKIEYVFPEELEEIKYRKPMGFQV